MKRVLIIFHFFVCLSFGYSQVTLDYYLPKMEYNPDIPTPYEVLGYHPGEWHVSHDQLLKYMKALDKASDRIEIIEYARTYENRPLILLLISSPQNLARKEDIRRSHLQLTDPNQSEKVNIDHLPAILLQGYSIHGNEASGANAALITAYYLAAGMGKQVLNTLDNVLILLDPCYNPDGLNRFSTWVNAHKSKNPVADPISRELNEVWPRGRTNHYWFDLNRDWLLLTHPESRGRIAVFHHWKPNVLTDHHEMGTNSTFFFQPGIPSRTNPNTPKINQDLTEEIGTYHAAALDSIGSLYYTKDSYDDYYYGKGSTYPDINGCIGILFEQASSRGHLQESIHGLLSFPFTIKNQFVTSLSTHKAVVRMRKKLLNYQRNFYINQAKKAKKSKIKGYVFTDTNKGKISRFIDILHAHQIDVYTLTKDVSSDRQFFDKNDSYYVPLNQNQYRMAKTIFEKVRSFPDSLFYDVSTWTMPLAFDIKYAPVKSKPKTGKKIDHLDIESSFLKTKKPYAYILRWNEYDAPSALYLLQKNGIKTMTTQKGFSIKTNKKTLHFLPGDIIIPLQNQSLSPNEIEKILDDASKKYIVDIYSVPTGWATGNMTLGSPNVKVLHKPTVAMIAGEGVSSYDAGEVWFHLDQRLNMPLTIIDKRQLYRADFSRYSTIIIVQGTYADLKESTLKNLQNWVQNGGNLILIKNAISWASKNNFLSLKKIENHKSKTGQKNYDAIRRYYGSQVLGGAIFRGEMDMTNPLCYGYSDKQIYLFRRGTDFFEMPQNTFSAPVKYAKYPIESGYIPRGVDTLASGRPAVTIHSKGKGIIICFQDSPLFRGYWYGGNKMFANALFFGDIINVGGKSKR